jgi:hypothetical protein
MREEKITADRLTAFSDAVFAVIVTVMVLELKAPDQAAFSALWPLWPTAISYAVSYLFIAIMHGLHAPGSHWLRSCFTQGCLYASMLPTTSSNTRYWPARTTRRCPGVGGAWRGADRSSSLGASRPPRWWRSSRRASASL